MTTIEKLYMICEEGKETEQYKALSTEDRQRLKKMFHGLKWIWENELDGEKARRSDNARNAFYQYYEPSDAGFIAQVFDRVFID